MTFEDTPGLRRHIAHLRDYGLSWKKIVQDVNRKFDCKTNEQQVKRVYKQYNDKRKELVSESPEMKRRVQRDLVYIFDRMEELESEVQEMITVLKNKENPDNKDFKLILECVREIRGTYKDHMDFLKKMEPKQQRAISAPSNINITQNIVNKLDEMEEQGMITINRASKLQAIDAEFVEAGEVKEDGSKGRNGQGQDRSQIEHRSEDDSRRVLSDEDPTDRGDTGADDGGDGDTGSSSQAATDGRFTGTPIVTVSVTKTGDPKRAFPPRKQVEPDKEHAGDEKAGQ